MLGTIPTRLNVAYSISWSERKGNRIIPRWRQISEKKRTSITTMGAKTQAYDIFPTPLFSHYPLPLSAGECAAPLIWSWSVSNIKIHIGHT